MKFRDAVDLRIKCVYCLRFPDGKCYVGKTHDLSDRVKIYLKCDSGQFSRSGKVIEAIKEFGLDNVELEVLFRLDGSNDKTDVEVCLSIIEVKYIRELECLHPRGYNVSLGGEVLNIPIEDITTDKDYIAQYNSSNKVMMLYDLDGVFLREYPSISSMAYDLGRDDNDVRSHIGRNTPYLGKYFIRVKRFGYCPERIDVPQAVVKERVKYKDIIQTRVVEKERVYSYQTPILAYDMNGDFVGEYASKSDACRKLVKTRNIVLGKYCSGYIFFKKDRDDYPKHIENHLALRKKATEEVYKPVEELSDLPENPYSSLHTKLKHDFKVLQYSLRGEFIKQHNSIRDASVDTGIRYSQIYNCINGKTRVAAGFLWRKAEE